MLEADLMFSTLAIDRLLRMMPRRLSRLTIVFLALTISACGGRQTPAPADELTDPVELLEAMLTRLDAIESARLRATLEYYGDGGRARVQQAVLARTPDLLRIETLSPFDTSLAVFMVDGQTLTFYDLQTQTYMSGSPTPENVARFVPFYMTAEDLVRVLFGGPPLDAASTDADEYTLQWDGRAGAYRMVLPLTAGGELVLHVQHGTWTVSGAAQYDVDGDPIFELRTGDFTTIEGDGFTTTMPQRLRFIMEGEDIDISLDVERIDMNVPLPDTLFQLAPPPGVEEILLP
ncbi:MAG: outer membrane lipoprotein-sorting protein [Bradymonadia bacterium]|jgi:outer membrane lipoprotein-sorting protein